MMAKLKLGRIDDDRPVKLVVELTAAVHRDLLRYGEALGREAGHDAIEPAKLIGPMLARFMATDRAFARLRPGSFQPGAPGAAGDCEFSAKARRRTARLP